MTTLQILAAVANGRMSPEDGARMILQNRRKGSTMNKTKAKNVLHWLAFAACIGGVCYIAFIAQGLGVAERITLAATSLGGLFVALGKIFPVLDKAVDALPGDEPTVPIAKPPVPPAAALALIVGLGLLAISSPARADANDPKFGRCLVANADKTCRLSEHFSAITPALALDLKTGDAVAGVGAASLGICHGLTYQPTLWWASGFDLCASVRAGTGQPNQYGFSMQLFAADYGAVGIGTLGTQRDGGLSWHGMLYLAPRLPVQ